MPRSRKTAETPAPPSVEGANLIEQYAMAVDPESQPAPAIEPEVAPAPTPVAAAEKPKHPAYLVRRAKEAGLEESEIDSLPADELKDAILLSKDRTREHQVAQQAVNAAGRPYDPTTGRLLPAEPAPAPEKPKFSLAELGFDMKKYPEIAPELENVLRDLVEPIINRLNEVTGGVGQLRDSEHRRNVTESLNQLDKLFTQHEGVFGKGSREDLDPDSPEYRRRAMVAREMEANGRATPGLSFKKNFELSAKALLGLTAPASPPPAPVVDDKGYKNGNTLKPTNRLIAEMKPGRAKAEAAVDDFLNNLEQDEAGTQPELPK